MFAQGDWATPAEQAEMLKVPSFVRLFVIHRVLNEVYGNMRNKDIDALVTQSTINKKLHEITKEILSRLIVVGIKEYMNKYYNEKVQANTIEIIFNQIILKQFETEYQNVTTYKTKKSKNDKQLEQENGDKNKYKNLLFNTEDIMCLIFQYLNEFIDLSNCSLVCCQWFYHSFNPKCIYIFDLKKLATATAKCKENDENNVTRMWQRLCNVKNIAFYNGGLKGPSNNNCVLLNKLSMLRNVEIIDNGTGSVEDIPGLKVILHNCKDKIGEYFIQLETEEKHQLSPLVLNNVKVLSFDSIYFAIIWSKKCERMNLLWISNIDDQWCEIVINDCDCSGIKHLIINNTTFDPITMDITKKSTKMLLDKLGKKFDNNNNLKLLIISFEDKIDACMVYIWKYLQAIIEKNNGDMELSIAQDLSNQDLEILSRAIIEMQPQIHKISISFGETWKTEKEWIKKILSKCAGKDNSSLEWITIQLYISFAESWIYRKLLKSLTSQFECKSGIMELFSGNRESFDSVIEIFSWMNGIQQKLGFLVTFDVYCQFETNIKVYFDTFCKLLFSMLIDKKIVMDITVLFTCINDNDRKPCHQTFEQYFNKQKITQEYKAPQCGINVVKYVIPRIEPIVLFEQKESITIGTIHKFNVINVDWLVRSAGRSNNL